MLSEDSFELIKTKTIKYDCCNVIHCTVKLIIYWTNYSNNSSIKV